MPNVTLTGSYAGYAFTAPGYTLTNLGTIGGGGLQVTGAGDSVINEGQIGGGGIYFAAYPGMALANEAGATIASTNIGIDFAGTGTATNAGIIAGGNSFGNYGIFLKAAGLVTNEAGGTINGYYAVNTGFGYPTGTMFAYYSPPLTVVNDGTITGATTHTSFESGAGIVVSAGGTIVNSSDGFITGAAAIVNKGTPGVTVINAGSIVGESADYHGYGVVLRGAGGSVTNQAGGFISGYFGVDIYVTSGNPTVVNNGTIVGNTTTFGIGIKLSGGSVSNNGTIAGGTGIDVATSRGTVTNYGLIDGSTETVGSGARLNSGGAFTNFATGIITGAANGVLIQGGVGSLINAGHIAASATSGTGAYIELGGAVTNQAGGTITGAIGVDILHYNGGGTLVNAGSISGTTAAVRFDPNANDRLIVDPGAQFSGTVDGGNTISPSPLYVSTLELASGASTGTLTGIGTQFINFGSIAFDAGASWFIAGSTAGLAGTISGFAHHETIEVSGITVTGSSFAGDVLTLNEASGSATLHLPGTFTTSDFIVTNVAGGADVSLACFREGTRIRTARGDVPVEQLHIGDLVPALHPAVAQPVVWLGHRRVDCRSHPRPQQAWPIRIAAGAFGAGQPQRDLFLSPDHAIYTDGVLIPIRLLVNGSTITQVPADDITYWHVELPRHAVLLAEGLAVESYLETNARADLAGGTLVTLHPDFAGRHWEAHGCAPLVLTGPVLASVRERLAARAAMADAA